MKKLNFLFLALCLTLSNLSNAQNPFESIGKKSKPMLTLSDGKYIEYFNNDSVRQIGSAMVNVYTEQIVAFVDRKEQAKKIHAQTSSRFLSIDPLARSFPYYTPYQYAGNKPINSIDLDGAEDLISITNKYANGDVQQINYTSEENCFKATLQVLSMATGTDYNSLPEHGTLVIENDYTHSEPQIRHAYNPTYAEVDGRSLFDKFQSYMGEKDADFQQRYYGPKGQRQAFEDLGKSSTWVKAGGLALSAFGQPELGVPLYNIGEGIDLAADIGLIGKDVSDGKKTDALIRVGAIIAGEATQGIIGSAKGNYKGSINARKIGENAISDQIIGGAKDAALDANKTDEGKK